MEEFNIDSASRSSIDVAVDNIINVINEAKEYAIPLSTRKFNSFKISSISKVLIAHRNYLKRQLSRCDSTLRSSFATLIRQCNLLINKTFHLTKIKIGL